MKSPSPLVRIVALLTVLGGALVEPGRTATAQDGPAKDSLEVLADRTDLVPIITDDQTKLRSTVLLPRNRDGGEVPSILILTPYRPDAMIKSYRPFLEKALGDGYAVVISNERGTSYSEGRYSLLANSAQDGSDVIGWITQQPWSDGKVGMFGCSAPGEVQHELNVQRPEGLAATVPIASGAGIGKIGPYNEQAGLFRGGAFQTGSWWFPWYRRFGQAFRPAFPPGMPDDLLRDAAKLWTLEPDRPSGYDMGKVIRTLPINAIMRSMHALPGDMDQFVNRLPNDPAWSKLNLGSEDDKYRTPMLMINSWYDAAVAPNLALYSFQREHADPSVRNDLYMVVAPSTHCGMLGEPPEPKPGERDLGDYRLDYTSLVSRWFDAHLKNDRQALDGVAKVQAFMMGTNQWRNYDSWPPREAIDTVFFLESGGNANTHFGDGALVKTLHVRRGDDQFTYDWRNPVPSLGGSMCCDGAFSGGSFDQSEIEQREDVLIYTSAPIEKTLEVAGFIRVELYLSSDVVDTDLTVKLLDVYPDGRAYNLDDTIQRVRWRNGLSEPELMEPGKIYRVELGPLATSNAFLPGHRIRVEISSSNFPRYDRNLNTGGKNFDESDGPVAHNTIHFGKEFPSRIVLPVVSKD